MGKGSAWRKTDFGKYYSNWPESMGPKKRTIKHITTDKSDVRLLLIGGDRTHELVPTLTDGGGEVLVEPTQTLDYPRDGRLTAQEASDKIREFAKKRPGFLIV